MKRPLASNRPIGPFYQREPEEQPKLMAGFPVELPPINPNAPDRDIVSELEQETARRFNLARAQVRVDTVNMSGFDAPEVRFISFPVRDENETTTAINIGRFRDRANDIVNSVLGEDLNANVTVWVGDVESGKEIMRQ